MSKQSTRQRTRQERRREELQRREAERRRAARTKRNTTVGIIAAVVLAIAGIVYLVIAQSKAPANPDYPAIDTIACDQLEQTAFHIHAHASLFINGQSVSIPANVGIAGDPSAPSCFYWLHTHSTDGVIHIEAPNGVSPTLKNFLDIWRTKFQQLGYPDQLDVTEGWQAYVNGKPFAGDFHTIPLRAHTLITLAYNSPGVKPDTTYNWNGL